MNYKEVIRMFSERKRKLSDLVENPGSLRTEKVQKLQGAIDEIDFVIAALNQSRDDDIQHGSLGIPGFIDPKQQQGFFARISNAAKSGKTQQMG